MLYGRLQDARGRLQHPGRDPCYPTVVMYHSVSERATRAWGPWHYGVTPEEFKAHMSQLNNSKNIVPLTRLVNWMMGYNSLPRDAVVLTFDDAYADFLHEVVPILEQYEFPATVYLPTAALNGDPWVPFEQRLAIAIMDVDYIDISLDGLSVNHTVESHSAVVDCYEEIHAAAKSLEPGFRERILEALDTDTSDEDRAVTPDELRELRDHPLVTVGAHGHAHVPFTSLSANEQREQVRQSKARLERILGEPPRHFSFPYGSFDRSALRAVEDAGFESAVTTRPRRVLPRDWNRPYTIPRIDASNGLTEYFPGL